MLSYPNAPPTGPELGWCSNGEAGDGQSQCLGCGTELDEPHTWEECIATLRAERVRLGDLLLERDVCVVCATLLCPAPEPHCDSCEVAYREGVRFKDPASGPPERGEFVD